MKTPHKAKIVLILLLALWGVNFQSYAQTNYEKADSIALSFTESYETVQELAQKLTAQLTSDEEKARVFFMWIANNVRYDCRKFHNPVKPEFKARTEEELREKINNWKEEQNLKTAKRKRGICEDYSQLFKALCDEISLDAVAIHGNARDFHRPNRSSHNNSHAWNAVKINDNWHLLDATWAAGHTDPKVTKFFRRISPGFFFTPPGWFAQNHLPEEEKWQLLDNPISEKDFPDQPVINYGQEKYKITDFALQVKNTPEKKKEKEIWMQFEKTPEVFVLTKRNSKPIDFQKEEIDDKVVFTFSGSHKKVVVFGGKSLRSRLEWLAVYKSEN